ncbi:zinc finger CCHC domain-containing protein 8 homolog [Drosophila albomicans]|uniref:Zinc finger CCHC domain-containing protein 8 homolog n=1 Tax=Drosophila albomicans TaxID=7291 RepID=A0A6P8Y4J8_DROAB|nr:zinc finger CCHC domain-containing protein 8 homolog [Drosophila albomicans]
MDASVIEINDSVITIESDADVEDGEVNDTDVEIINLTANSQSPSNPPQSNTTTTNEHLEESEPPIFEVTFKNKIDYERLHDRVLQGLKKTFAANEFEFKTNEAITRIGAFIRTPTPLPDNDLFMIDTAPSSKLNAAQVPSYKRTHTDVLDEDTANRKRLKAEAVNKCFRPKVQSACFNCGGTDHSLRECTRPRNQSRIQRARKKNTRTERYHVDTEQRFAHIRPGRISTKTRHAMGYSRGELPFMFYRMRVLGYPPAWLEEAKVQSSGITLFNADGTEVQGPEEEEGEADSFKYDVNKIIDFPGYNAEPGSKFYDDFQHHNVPHFQEHQLKSNFIKSLGENIIKGYKRKKLIDLPTPHDTQQTSLEDSTNLVAQDMELEDDEVHDAMQPPLPAEPSLPAPPPPPAEPEDSAPQRRSSPTLEDLKAQQEELLQQLESNTSLNTSSPSTSQVEEESPAALVKPAVFRASIQGTPILKFSEFDKLPEGDKFKAGISDVINFENLPDSTGKYEQMKGLLKDVRHKMEKLQNADD